MTLQAESALMSAAHAGKELGDWRLEQQALTGEASSLTPAWSLLSMLLLQLLQILLEGPSCVLQTPGDI